MQAANMMTRVVVRCNDELGAAPLSWIILEPNIIQVIAKTPADAR